MKNKLEYRLYGLVPYNISPIQQGIQFGHGVVEYAQKHFRDVNYQEWAKNHKTFIILNGGTTNNTKKGTMQKHADSLKKNKIKHSLFFEPDLNDTLTGICFLVDERVFNREKYPDFDSSPSIPNITKKEWIKSIGGKENEFLREFLRPFRLA